MNLSLFALLTASAIQTCFADAGIWGPVSWTEANTNTLYPFLLKQAGLISMRYQQLYSSSLFSNLDGNVYLKSLEFLPESLGISGQPVWTVPNMQINLSTTTNTGLSSVFSENAGPDE